MSIFYCPKIVTYIYLPSKNNNAILCLLVFLDLMHLAHSHGPNWFSHSPNWCIGHNTAVFDIAFPPNLRSADDHMTEH